MPAPIDRDRLVDRTYPADAPQPELDFLAYLEDGLGWGRGLGVLQRMTSHLYRHSQCSHGRPDKGPCESYVDGGGVCVWADWPDEGRYNPDAP